MAKHNELDCAAIGQRLRAARVKRHLTQEALAERAELSTSFIGHIERGEKPASVETMVRLCDVLSLSLDYAILGRINDCDQSQCALYRDMIELLKKYGEGLPGRYP